MAISRNIKPDRGLTSRMLLTGFLLVLLYGLVVGILIAIGLSYAIVLVIAFALIFCQYWFSAKIAMYAMHAKEVTPEQAPELHGVVDRLCALADMPKPKVAIATTDIPNAFATGRSPKSSVVCVTSGLLRRLDEPEVEAVLSHELCHVAHRDVAVMTIASGLGMIAGLMTRVSCSIRRSSAVAGVAATTSRARPHSSRWSCCWSRSSCTSSASCSPWRCRGTASWPPTVRGRS